MLSTSRISSELAFAICRGDLNTVNYLIGDNPLPKGGYSLLCMALEYRHREIAKLLMNKGANVNHKFQSLTNTPLHFAVINYDIEMVRMLLDRFAHVNATNGGGLTALHYATKANMLDIALLLILHGADMNARDNCGRTSLRVAIENGSTHIAVVFVQHGADIKTRDRNGSNMLHIAVASGHLDIVKFVVTEGVCINGRNTGGESPLCIAIKKKHTEVAKYLLEQGASVNCVCNYRNKYTPLHAACENDLNDIVGLLLHKGADVNAVAKRRITPIHLAMRSHNYGMIEMLLNYGANVDTENEDGKTILYLAVIRDDLLMVNQILSRGPDVHNSGNRNALKIAVRQWRESFIDIVRALLRYGFTFRPEDATDSKLLSAVIGKMTPETLHTVAEVYVILRDLSQPLRTDVKKRLMQIIWAFLEWFDVDLNSVVVGQNLPIYRAVFPNTLSPRSLDDVDCIVENIMDFLACIKSTFQSRIGLMALYLAVQNDDKSILQVFVENLPYAQLKGKSGSTLFLFAVEEGAEDVCKLLVKRGADVNVKNSGTTVLHQAIEYAEKGIVEFLLAHGARVNARDESGATPLHVNAAYVDAETQSQDICSLLIERGAHVNAKEEHGLTPLHRAVQEDNTEIIQMLLEHGADVNAKDRSGVTPLHFAASAGTNEIFMLLVKSGADVHARTEDGMTALHIAAISDHACVMKILLNSGLDVDSVDNNGNTALHLAILTRQVNATLILIVNGADVNIVNKSNQTAFHVVDDPEFIDRSWIIRFEDNSSYVDEEHKYYVYSKWGRLYSGEHECNDNWCSRDHDVHSTFLIVVRYLIQMRIANMDMRDFENVPANTDIKFCPQYREKCLEEIKRMKSIKIDNTTVTFYDLLTKRVQRLASFARNEDIVREMKLNNYQTLFPEYAIMIKSNFKKAMKRKQLEDESEKYFRMCFGIYYDFIPRTFSDKLFDYLSDADLMNLRESYH